jgi:asparagine synthase (glutamine-hydrolysing)
MKLFGIVAGGKSKSQIEKILCKMAESFRIESSTKDLFSDDGVGFGHLNVADLDRNQPVFSTDKSSFIVFCGRIYGYEKQQEELAKEGYVFVDDSESEFILHSFQKYGKDFAKNLNGIFVIITWNGKRNELVIVNDRYGMKPLYYYENKGKFIFSSEVKAIVASDEVEKEIDWDGWRDVFSYGYLLGDKTLFRNICSIPNASILTFKDQNVSIAHYWRYEDIKVDYCKSEDYFVNRGVQVLKDSILKQTRGMKRSQVLLSGGYDSRAIACSLKYFANVPFETYTGILHGTGSKDTKYAKLLSRELNFQNVGIMDNKDVYKRYFVDMIYFLDGFSFEHLWIMPVAKKLMKGVPTFDGIAGDIVFDEIHSLPFDKSRRKFGREEVISVIYRNLNVGSSKLSSFFVSDVQCKIRPTDSSIRSEVCKIEQTDYLFSTFFIKNRTRSSVSLISSNIISNKTSSLFPFLENELVQLSMSIPPEMKVRNQIYLKILRKAFPQAMRIRTTHDKTLLEACTDFPALIIKKILLGRNFMRISNKLDLKIPEPLRSRLIRKRLLALRPKKEDLLYLERLVKRLELPPFICKDRLFKEITSHKRYKRDYGYFLIPIASFCLWYNLFYKDHPDRPEDIKERVE